MLVAVVSHEGGTVRAFGQPVLPPTTFWDFGSIKERIRKGEVPSEYRNNALPVWANDGSVFLAFYSEPEVRRYAPDGALLWSRLLADPTLESARAAFIHKNTEETNPAILYTLQYVQDARVVGDDLWLLLNTTDGTDGVLLVLDGADGTLRRRISLRGTPDTRQFGVDLERRRLYVTVPGEAMVVAFALK